MSFASIINSQAETAGGTWIKLRETGEAIAGELLEIIERPKTWEGQPVLSRKGNPRSEWVITLRVEPADADDDGIRKVVAAEGLQWAIQDHLKATGHRFPDTWGGRLAIGVKRGAPTTTSQVEEWAVNYQPPATGAAAAINAAVDAQPADTVDPLAGLI